MLGSEFELEAHIRVCKAWTWAMVLYSEKIVIEFYTMVTEEINLVININKTLTTFDIFIQNTTCIYCAASIQQDAINLNSI